MKNAKSGGGWLGGSGRLPGGSGLGIGSEGGKGPVAGAYITACLPQLHEYGGPSCSSTLVRRLLQLFSVSRGPLISKHTGVRGIGHLQQRQEGGLLVCQLSPCFFLGLLRGACSSSLS